MQIKSKIWGHRLAQTGIALASVSIFGAGAAMAGADATFNTALTSFTGYLQGSGGKIITVLSLAGGIVGLASGRFSLNGDQFASVSKISTGIVGSEASIGGAASIHASRENADVASRTNTRGLEKFTTRATDNSEDNSGRFTLGESDSTTSSSGTFARDSSYRDKSRTESSASGTESRVSEADERRAAATRYREIGNRMVAEASYAQSHGFQMSSDMSNLIQERYQDLRRERPDLHLPDLANPNLSLPEMQRRDQGVSAVMSDLLGDLKARRISELGDVGGIGSMGTLGSNADLGFPATPALSGSEGQVSGASVALPAAPAGNVDGKPFARELGIGLKSGANIRSIDGGLVPAMAAVATEAERLGLPRPIITSGNDSSLHESRSSHYDNRALDFRGRGITVEQGRQWASSVGQSLGPGYGVQFEVFPDKPNRNHLHITKRKS